MSYTGVLGTIPSSTVTATTITSPAATNLTIQSAGTTAMTIDTSQNVGIGTSSPSLKLTVSSGASNTTNTTGQARVSADVATMDLVAFGSAATSYGMWGASEVGVFSTNPINLMTTGAVPIKFATGGTTERMRIDSSGNVGIGTTSPNAKLEVYGQRVRINAAADPGVELANTTTVKGYMFYDSTNDLVTVRHASTGTGIAVNSSGNVLVGTTSAPSAGVCGAFYSSVNNYRNFVVSNTYAGNSGTINSLLTSSANNTNSYHFVGNTGGTDKFYIYGNGTYGTVSDKNLKKNIETARDGYLNDLNKLRVVKYNWESDDDQTPKELGWIAQEVAEVFPGLVQDGIKQEDGSVYKQVKTSVLPFILLKAIQEQQATITTLTARIAALESR